MREMRELGGTEPPSFLAPSPLIFLPVSRSPAPSPFTPAMQARFPLVSYAAATKKRLRRRLDFPR